MDEQAGFDLKDTGGNMDVVLVRCNADSLRERAGREDGKQLEGSRWTVLAANVEDARTLSGGLGVDTIHFEFQDASGWTVYRFFQNGIEVESYGFGPDYSDEMEEAGMDQEISESPWDLEASNGDTRWGFASKLREVSERDLKKELAFIDEFFKTQKAYLGLEALPMENAGE